MKVMGEAEIEDILVDTPEIIWDRTKEKAGIDAVSVYKKIKEAK